MATEYTPLSLLRLVRQDLRVYAAATWPDSSANRVFLAESPLDALQRLFDGPVGCVIAVAWGGETELGDQPQRPLVTHKIEVYVGHRLAPTVQPRAELIDAVVAPGGRPLLAVVNEVRSRVHSLQFADDVSDRYLRYAGTEPVSGLEDNRPIFSAYKMTFYLNAAVAVGSWRDVNNIEE